MAQHIIALCMIVMMTVIFVQTLSRYVIFYSLPWSEELSRYLYVTLTLLGLNLAVTSKQLVRIDIIDNYVKGPWLNIIRQLLALIITVFFFVSSFGMVDVSQYQTSPAMGLSMQIMYTIVSAGFLLSALACAFELYDAIFGKHAPTDSAEV